MELAEVSEKEINTKGITTLFNPSDTQGIIRFNVMHKQLVDHITEGPIFQPEDTTQWQQLDLELLKKQHDDLGTQEYLKKLIRQHEKNKENLVTQAAQAVKSAAQKRNPESHIAMEQAMIALQKKAVLIEELQQIQNKNEMMLSEKTDADSCDAASSSSYSKSTED